MGRALLWITLLCVLVCAYAKVVEKKDVPAKEVVHAKDPVKAPQQKNEHDHEENEDDHEDEDISDDEIRDALAEELMDGLEDEDLDENAHPLEQLDVEDLTDEEIAAVKDAMPRPFIRRFIRRSSRWISRAARKPVRWTVRTVRNIGNTARRWRFRFRRRYSYYRGRRYYFGRRRFRYYIGDNKEKSKVTKDDKVKRDE